MSVEGRRSTPERAAGVDRDADRASRWYSRPVIVMVGARRTRAVHLCGAGQRSSHRTLDLRATTIQGPDEAPPADHARPQRSSGAPVQAWVGTGELPAGGGGLWSTAPDLARLATAARDGTAPGAAAAEPRYEHTPEQRVGLGWITTDHDGRTVTWHNGATNGSSSVGFTDDAVVVVLATYSILLNHHTRGSALSAGVCVAGDRSAQRDVAGRARRAMLAEAWCSRRRHG